MGFAHFAGADSGFAGVIRRRTGEPMVTVTNVATNRQRVTVSTREGLYTAPSLAPGEYRLDVELSGFKPVRREGIHLSTGEKARIDLGLVVGDVHEQITVTGDAAAVPVKAPGLQVAVNPVIAEPPFDAGGVKLMEAWPLPGVAMPMVGAPGAVAAITIEKFCVAVPAELVAVTTPVKVPLAFGVPESVPADAFSVRPPGNAPEVRLKVGAGEPLAVKVCE